jgi:hypothetical protein
VGLAGQMAPWIQRIIRLVPWPAGGLFPDRVTMLAWQELCEASGLDI